MTTTPTPSPDSLLREALSRFCQTLRDNRWGYIAMEIDAILAQHPQQGQRLVEASPEADVNDRMSIMVRWPDGETLEYWLVPPSPQSVGAPVLDGAYLRNLIANMQSMRDRMMPTLTAKFGEAFDGDFDVMLEAINTLKRCAAAPTAPVPPSERNEGGGDAVALPMDTAPRDGTLVRLLVEFEEHNVEDGENPAWTIGAVTVIDDDPAVLQFVGWNWCQDHWTDGIGTPVGWLPFHPAPTASATAQSEGGLRDRVVPALSVLRTMLRVAGLTRGERMADELIAEIENTPAPDAAGREAPHDPDLCGVTQVPGLPPGWTIGEFTDGSGFYFRSPSGDGCTFDTEFEKGYPGASVLGELLRTLIAKRGEA